MEDHHLFPRDWLGNNRDPQKTSRFGRPCGTLILNRIFVSKEANEKAKAQVPPNYLCQLTAEERRVLQIPESFLAP